MFLQIYWNRFNHIGKYFALILRNFWSTDMFQKKNIVSFFLEQRSTAISYYAEHIKY